MQRRGSSASAGSWPVAVQYYTQPNDAWHRHIAKIATYIRVASPSADSRRPANGKAASDALTN